MRGDGDMNYIVSLLKFIFGLLGGLVALAMVGFIIFMIMLIV